MPKGNFQTPTLRDFLPASSLWKELACGGQSQVLLHLDIYHGLSSNPLHSSGLSSRIRPYGMIKSLYLKNRSVSSNSKGQEPPSCLQKVKTGLIFDLNNWRMIRERHLIDSKEFLNGGASVFRQQTRSHFVAKNSSVLGSFIGV